MSSISYYPPMQQHVDLTSFGFTPTESLVYQVLLTSGPGTGYAVARSAGLARANAYSALEGLVAKGAARADGGRPKRYRPEPASALVARISNNYGQALERLSNVLDEISIPSTPTIVEIESGRAVLQLISHDIARATRSVALLAPTDAYPLLAPTLRRPVAAGLPVSLWSNGPVELEFAEVRIVEDGLQWPGAPIIAVVDDRSAVVGSREGNDVQGHWSSAPTLVAAARLSIERFGRL
jgi:HTH-type transcriptional regulator, sugar sensing transcriptional regulator